MSRKRTTRDQYASFGLLTTRWHDNDVYGHMNNVVYYALFDTVVNRWLKLEAGLPVPEGDLIGLVVRTACTYHESLGWPEPVESGLSTERVGTSSITYRIGLFRPEAQQAAAEGHFTHVYVDAGTRRPVPLPDFLRRAADAILRDHG